MNKTIFTFTITGVMVFVGLMGFGQQNKKAEEARKDIDEAHIELKEAKKDSISDCEKFRKYSEERISKNQEKIADLKTKRPNGTKEVKEKYDKKVLVLEQKNNELKKRIEVCTNETAWELFKIKFNQDMDDLETYINIDVNTSLTNYPTNH